MARNPMSREDEVTAWQFWCKHQAAPPEWRARVIAKALGRYPKTIRRLCESIERGERRKPIPPLPHRLYLIRAGWFVGDADGAGHGTQDCPACAEMPTLPVVEVCELCANLRIVPKVLVGWYHEVTGAGKGRTRLVPGGEHRGRWLAGARVSRMGHCAD